MRQPDNPVKVFYFIITGERRETAPGSPSLRVYGELGSALAMYIIEKLT